MPRKIKNNFYQLESFSRLPQIIHGFSVRKLGDMNPQRNPGNWENIKNFLTLLGLNGQNLVLMGQVHGGKVRGVGNLEKEKILPGIDGLVTNKSQVILGVKTADCLPILFCDPRQKIIGVAHAGWKGILQGIVFAVLGKMVNLGAKAENTLVGIGPHIGGCCYTVLPERAEIFQRKFGDLPGMIFPENKQLHLNLVIPVVKQIESKGIKKENLEVMLSCTSCQNNLFFSFRKEGKIKGKMLSVISLIK